MGETAYAPCGDLSLAYQVFGDGPIELVVMGPFASHIELFWTLPEFKSFFDQLATFCRIVLFDKAGVGLSDPVPKVRTLDDRAAEIEAVMNAVGFKTAALLALSEGGPAAIVFAAKRPERTRALILASTFSYTGMVGWDEVDCDPAELRARVLTELGDDYTPSVEQIARIQNFGRAVRSAWGSGAALKLLIPSVRSTRQLGTLERMSASPGMARATLEAMFQIDVRPILPTITLPTLVTHAHDDVGLPVQCGRYLADHIPGARMLEVAGTDHAPWFTDTDAILTEIEEFLTGSHAAPPQSHRALRTVLFTDIVASTQRAAVAGDERWRAVLQRFGQITAELAERFGGTVVKSTGDGHLTTFDGPTQAIRCAEDLRSETEKLGIDIRVGIHSGECELIDADIGGIAVHIAARILGKAGRARSSSQARFGTWLSVRARASRAAAPLNCVVYPAYSSSWRSIATGPRAGSAEAELASAPTPGPRTAMQPSDRAVEVIARRAPWMLAGMARLTGSQIRARNRLHRGRFHR